MLNQFSRTQLLLGLEGMESLYKKKVAVFGIGGVGGYDACRDSDGDDLLVTDDTLTATFGAFVLDHCSFAAAGLAIRLGLSLARERLTWHEKQRQR